jgi:hypothetical protein
MPNNLSGDGYKLSLKLFKLQQNLFFAKKKKKKKFGSKLVGQKWTHLGQCRPVTSTAARAVLSFFTFIRSDIWASSPIPGGASTMNLHLSIFHENLLHSLSLFLFLFFY